MRTSPNSSHISRWRRARQGFLLGCFVSAIVLLLWVGNLFAQLRLRLNDTYFVPAPVSDTITIVAIDDASLEMYGRSLTDWSRTVYADLVETLNAAQARVIAFDILFVDESEGDDAFITAIQAARASDARTRTVMPAVGVQYAGEVSGGAQTIQFQEALLPIDSIRGVADYVGYVNVIPDVDGSIRRRPSLVQVNEASGISFSIAAYLAYLRIPSAAMSQVVVAHQGLLEVTPERQIPIDEYGFWLQNYFGPPYSEGQVTFPVVSLVDVLNGNFDPTLFEDKLVLVGVMNATVVVDDYIVPSSSGGHLMSGVEIHANAVETLIQNRFLHEQSSLSQAVMIVMLSLIASMVYVQFRWYWIVPLALLMLFSWVIVVFTVFNARLEIINLFHSGMALVFPVIAVTGWNISVERWRRRNTEFLLKSVVESSSQRLSLERVLNSLIDDLQSLLGASQGGIWLWDDERRGLKRTHVWGNPPQTLDNLCRDVLEARTMLVQPDRVGVPMVWQGRLIGVITAQLNGDQTPDENALNLLQDLAQRIAPNIENTVLYTNSERQKTLLEAILFGSQAGIVVLDDKLRIVRSNSVLNKTLPLINTPDKTLPDILQAVKVLDETVAKVRDGFASGRPFQQEIRIDVSTFNLDAAPLNDYKQWVVILSDVTPLAELSQLKTRMMRLATHDLKNPLGRVLGYGNAILELTDGTNELSERYRTFLEHVVKAGEDMNRIITDILNSEQVRSTVFEREPVDMRQIVNQALVHFQTAIANKRQTVTTNMNENLPLVSGNARYLAQVVSNLVSNATKYTPEEGHITLSLYSTEQHILRLEVQDTGYGMTEEAQLKLFTDFYRIRTAATAHVTGTGLGLSLSKWIVEAHSGRIWVQSEAGIGSTFFVELPIIQEVKDVASV